MSSPISGRGVAVFPTAKTRSLLGIREADLVTAPTSDGIYVNLVWMARRKCLLMTESRTGFWRGSPEEGVPSMGRPNKYPDR